METNTNNSKTLLEMDLLIHAYQTDSLTQDQKLFFKQILSVMRRALFELARLYMVKLIGKEATFEVVQNGGFANFVSFVLSKTSGLVLQELQQGLAPGTLVLEFEYKSTPVKEEKPVA